MSAASGRRGTPGTSTSPSTALESTMVGSAAAGTRRASRIAAPPLRREAEPAHVRGRRGGERVPQDLDGGREERLRVVLDATRGGADGQDFSVGLRARRARGVEEDRAYPGRALVDRQHQRFARPLTHRLCFYCNGPPPGKVRAPKETDDAREDATGRHRGRGRRRRAEAARPRLQDRE